LQNLIITIKKHYMSNFIDNLKGLATNELVKATASSLGESESSIGKALGGILPTLMFSTLQSKSAIHPVLSDLLTKAGNETGMLPSIIKGVQEQDEQSVSLGIGNSIVEALFGKDSASISNLISNFAGTRSSSSSALLCIGSSLVASMLGGKMKSEGLSFNSILGWLGQHKTDLAAALPNTLGAFVGAPAVVEKPSAQAQPVSKPLDNNTTKNRWIFPILLLTLLAIGIFWWMKGCNNPSKENEVDTAIIDSAGESINSAVDNAIGQIDTAIVADSESAEGHLDEAGNWIATKGDSTIIKLDNGIEIEAFKGSLEEKLHAFIKDPGAKPGDEVWFNFEDLLFETGRSTLKKGSMKQLNNTCEILKAYPEVKIKLGGYTDNSGDSTKNFRLSTARAKTVFEAMLNKGITKASFDAQPYEGYGPKHPVADNNTEEGRARNRRISLSVRAK
jgi:OOP family OmpA-OmpF porin